MRARACAGSSGLPPCSYGSHFLLKVAASSTVHCPGLPARAAPPAATAASREAGWLAPELAPFAFDGSRSISASLRPADGVHARPCRSAAQAGPIFTFHTCAPTRCTGGSGREPRAPLPYRLALGQMHDLPLARRAAHQRGHSVPPPRRQGRHGVLLVVTVFLGPCSSVRASCLT